MNCRISRRFCTARHSGMVVEMSLCFQGDRPFQMGMTCSRGSGPLDESDNPTDRFMTAADSGASLRQKYGCRVACILL
jgi:hypothetical protein